MEAAAAAVVAAVMEAEGAVMVGEAMEEAAGDTTENLHWSPADAC